MAIAMRMTSSISENITQVIQNRKVIALAVCCVAGLGSVLLGRDTNWDLLNYHLYVPYAYFHDRYLYDVGPGQVQSFFNPTASLLFYALISSYLNELPRVVAFIMGALHGINAVVIMAIANHVLKPINPSERLTLQFTAVAIGVTSAGVISVLGTSTGDLTNSIFILASLLAMLQAAASTANRYPTWSFGLSGLLVGIGIGLKYTAAIYAPALFVILLFVAFHRRMIIVLLTFGVSSAVGFLLVAGHHLLRLWRLFGNPIFPFMSNVFLSPYYETTALRDERFLPRNVGQIVAYPFYWAHMNANIVSELSFRDLRSAFAYVAIIVGTLYFIIRKFKSGRDGDGFSETKGLFIIYIFCIISYTCWALGFGIYRYFLPIEMLTGIVIVGTIIWLIPNHAARVLLAVVALCILMATTKYFQWGRDTYGKKYIDVLVPNLPRHSLVLIPTNSPVSYFIPFAEPTARYLGIQNNYLNFSQTNNLVHLIKELLKTSPAPKFILVDGGTLADLDEDQQRDLEATRELLAELRLRINNESCQTIQSSIDRKGPALCRVEPYNRN